MLFWGIRSQNRAHHDWFLHIEIFLGTQGFRSGVDLWKGGNLDKMAKNCIKITKSRFRGQSSGDNEGDKLMFWLVGGSSSPPFPHWGKPWHQTSALLKKVFPFENWKKEHHHWIQHLLICLCNTFFLDWQFWFYGPNFSKEGIFSLGPNLYKRVQNRKKWTSPRLCHIKIIAGTKFQFKLRDLIFWPNLAKKGYFWSKTAKLCFWIYPWCILTILNFFVHGKAQTTTF